MKKIIIRVLLVLLGLIVLYIVINLFDAGEVTPGFSAKDIPKGTFDAKNGYYRLWSLIEPAGIDVVICVQEGEQFASALANP